MNSLVDRLLLDLVGKELTRIAFDFQTRLLFDGDWELVLHGAATLSTPTSGDVAFEGDEARAVAIELIGLRRQVVTNCSIDMDASVLRLDLGAAVVTAGPDADFEAWELLGPDGVKIICLPGGGEPAVWGRRNDPS